MTPLTDMRLTWLLVRLSEHGQDIAKLLEEIVAAGIELERRVQALEAEKSEVQGPAQ